MDRPTLIEAMSEALEYNTSQIKTAMPAKITDVTNLGSQKISVQPVIGDYPIIPDVPLIWPRGSSGYLLFPLSVGDTGLLIVCESDLAEWRRTGETGEAADIARHHIQNSVFIPGLVKASDTLATASGATVLDGNSDLRLGDVSATQPILLGDDTVTAITTWASAVSAAITALGGDVTAELADLIADLVLAKSTKVKSS